jgi:PAS domain S-box-containing protein
VPQKRSNSRKTKRASLAKPSAAKNFDAPLIEANSRLKRKADDLLFLLDRQARVLDITLSSISDFAYIFDREGRFVFVNQALLNLWGLKLANAVGKNFFELRYPDELAARLQRQIQTVFETKAGLTDETEYASQTGAGGYYEYIFRPVLDRAGNVELVACSTRDITDHKRVEAELRLVRNAFALSLNLSKVRSSSAPGNLKSATRMSCSNRNISANFPYV